MRRKDWSKLFFQFLEDIIGIWACQIIENNACSTQSLSAIFQRQKGIFESGRRFIINDFINVCQLLFEAYFECRFEMFVLYFIKLRSLIL